MNFQVQYVKLHATLSVAGLRTPAGRSSCPSQAISRVFLLSLSPSRMARLVFAILRMAFTKRSILLMQGCMNKASWKAPAVITPTRTTLAVGSG